MSARPRILVTNDDGIDSAGLAALMDAAVAFDAEVVVAAPAEQSSGTGAGLTAVGHDGRIAMHRRPAAGAVSVYAVEATPAMIVLLAVYGAFGDPPDWVLSGVNHGANVGRAVLHSGTVGAALTAAYHGMPALAVSLDVGHEPVGDPHWATATEHSLAVLAQVGELGPGTIANLNVPNLPAAGVLGMRAAPLATFGTVQIGLVESGEDFVRTELTGSADHDAGVDCDLNWLARGYATVTVVEAVAEVFTPVGHWVAPQDQSRIEGVVMPQRAWSAKRERQYEHIKDSAKERGVSADLAEEIAARTVNKERARAGEAKKSSKLSTSDISSGRRGGMRSHQGPGGRTRDQLYEEAKHKNIKGRSKMNKAQLERAVNRD